MKMEFKPCGCGSMREHLDKASRWMVKIAEEEDLCSGSVFVMTRFMAALGIIAHSQNLTHFYRKEGPIAALGVISGLANARDEIDALAAASDEFTDAYNAYVEAANVAFKERSFDQGGVDTSHADSLLRKTLKGD
jgi:hypothetical protein